MIDINSDIAIDNAIRAYVKACMSLRAIIKVHSDVLPLGVVSCGLFAEYYAKMYLEWKYPNGQLEYGRANEVGWDLLLRLDNFDFIRYQIKAVSVYNKKRSISPIGNNCDRLIVTCLDEDYFPMRIYLFDDLSLISRARRNCQLTAPDLYIKSQRGSLEFHKFASEITEEFWDALM